MTRYMNNDIKIEVVARLYITLSIFGFVFILLQAFAFKFSNFYNIFILI